MNLDGFSIPIAHPITRSPVVSCALDFTSGAQRVFKNGADRVGLFMQVAPDEHRLLIVAKDGATAVGLWAGERRDWVWIGYTWPDGLVLTQEMLFRYEAWMCDPRGWMDPGSLPEPKEEKQP